MFLRRDQGLDWAIVLAGGAGTRLHSLARDRQGRPVPKQYCSLRGGRSLLGDALARAERLVPRSRVLAVVAAEHSQFWAVELAHLPVHNVIVQPQNRGTAPGILLPLLALLDRDPEARVVLLPSDHFVADEGALARTLRRARSDIEELQGWVMLLGIEPDAPVDDYGWILPGPSTGAVRPVAAFFEKPKPSAAAELRARGAVWNSFVMSARAATLLELYASRLPHLLLAFQDARPLQRARNAAELYRRLEPADFSRDVLTGSEVSLRLRTASGCGWADLGTPERVRQVLATLPPDPQTIRGRACADLASLVAGRRTLRPTLPSRMPVAEPALPSAG